MNLTTPADQSGVYEQVTLDWCVKVDGINIFSKLFVYLRTHHVRLQYNERVRHALETAAPGEELLARVNDETAQALLGTAGAAAAPAAATGAAAAHVALLVRTLVLPLPRPPPLALLFWRPSASWDARVVVVA